MLKRVLSLCVAAMLLASLLAGCGSYAKLDALAGTWSTCVDEEDSYILDVLAFLELYEEEIALVETSGMQLVRVVEFHKDLTYSFRYDSEATRTTVRNYLESVFLQLYEKREKLDSLYETSFAMYSQETFLKFYATMYERETFDELLDAMVEEVYDYEALDQPYETGTYRILGDRIYCTKSGETEATYLEYTVTESTLELVYLEGTEVYQKEA